jgi:POT family proton-dependent oligopeptide transporter
MSVYLLSILGGFIADNFIGARRAVFIGGIIIATGHFTMASAIRCLVLHGPCPHRPRHRPAQAQHLHDGRQSLPPRATNAATRASRFSTWASTSAPSSHRWSPVTLPSILENPAHRWGLDPSHSWHWGFGRRRRRHDLGLIVYVRPTRTARHVGARPPSRTDAARPWGTLALVALGSLALIAAMKASDTYPVLVYALFAIQIAAILFFAFRPDPDSKRMAAILVFFFAAEIFWAIFEQTGSSITLFADKLTNNVAFGSAFPPRGGSPSTPSGSSSSPPSSPTSGSPSATNSPPARRNSPSASSS